MDTSVLANDFNNYFYAFKSPAFKPDISNSAESEKSVDVKALVESSSGIHDGVKVTITPKENLDSVDIPKSKTYVTEPGSIIRKDTNPNVSESGAPLSQRITMAAVRSDIGTPSDEAMNALLDHSSSQKVDVAAIASLSNIGVIDQSSATFKSRTELGEFNGSGMAVSENGEVVAYLVKEGVPLRESSESNLSLELVSEQGNKISIDVSALDRYNRYFQSDAEKRHIGVARDLEITLNSEIALNEAEAESINNALEALNPLLNSFHENLAVSQNDLSNLTTLVEDQSGTISDLSLNLSTYEGRHSISVNKAKDEKAVIATEEVTEEIYQDQAASYSYAALSIGQYNEDASEAAWQVANTKTNSNYNIINAARQELEFSTRALVASVFE